MYILANYFRRGWKEETIGQMERLAAEQRDYLDDCTKKAHFPRELYREMGKRGWIGPMTPTEHGGLGGGAAEYCLIEEEVGRLGLVSPQVSIQGQLWINLWGSNTQKQRYLRGLSGGEIIFCEAISEPGAGSSLKKMNTTARREGSEWLISGSKTHINLGHVADLMIVYASAEEGLTSFLVEAGQQGIRTRQTDPIGMRLFPTADVDFDSVRVPDSALLGKPGEGMKTFLSTFNVSRLGNASELIGFGRRALTEAVRYAKDRRVGDQSLVTDFQGIQWTIADCYAQLHAASLARDQAAMLVDRGEEHSLQTTLAKKLAVDAAERTVNESFALIGGHGLYENTPFRQILCDVKSLRVAGGSLEILRNYIARRILKSENLAGLA